MATSCRHSAFCEWRHFTFHHSGSSHTAAQFPQASSPVVQIMVLSVAGGLSADGVIGVLPVFCPLDFNFRYMVFGLRAGPGRFR